MARRVLYLLLLTAASCMETKETVQRMVMVRRTGSDLQPAATGYIYKKDNEGPASVVKMGESEILEQLKKLPRNAYGQTAAYRAPIQVAASPEYAKQTDENKAASDKTAYVIPVTEDTHEDDKGDGFVKENYAELFKEYLSDFGDDDVPGDFEGSFSPYGSDFADYLHNYGDHGFHDNDGEEADYGSEGRSAHGDKGQAGYASKHHYGKGDGKDYHNEHHQSFSISKGTAHSKKYGDADADGANFGHAEASKSEEGDGYKLFEKENLAKDLGLYDGEAEGGNFGQYNVGQEYNRRAAGGLQARSGDVSGFDEAGYSKTGFGELGFGDQLDDASFDGEQDDPHQGTGFTSELGYPDRKGYSFNVKHR